MSKTGGEALHGGDVGGPAEVQDGGFERPCFRDLLRFPHLREPSVLGAFLSDRDLKGMVGVDPALHHDDSVWKERFERRQNTMAELKQAARDVALKAREHFELLQQEIGRGGPWWRTTSPEVVRDVTELFLRSTVSGLDAARLLQALAEEMVDVVFDSEHLVRQFLPGPAPEQQLFWPNGTEVVSTEEERRRTRESSLRERVADARRGALEATRELRLLRLPWEACQLFHHDGRTGGFEEPLAQWRAARGYNCSTSIVTSMGGPTNFDQERYKHLCARDALCWYSEVPTRPGAVWPKGVVVRGTLLLDRKRPPVVEIGVRGKEGPGDRIATAECFLRIKNVWRRHTKDCSTLCMSKEETDVVFNVYLYPARPPPI